MMMTLMKKKMLMMNMMMMIMKKKMMMIMMKMIRPVLDSKKNALKMDIIFVESTKKVNDKNSLIYCKR